MNGDLGSAGGPLAEPRWPTLPEPVLVVGGYGYRNVGDEAILAGLLRRLAGRRLTVVSRLPAETQAMHRVRAVSTWSAGPELRRHRSVVIGGGGLFGVDMGAIGGMLPAFGLAATAVGREVALLGISLDADAPRGRLALVRLLANGASTVQVRDQASAELLAGNAHPMVGPDLSAAMEPAAPAIGAALLRAAGLRLSRPVVGLSLTALGGSSRAAVLEAVSAAVDAMPEVQFCFVPMSQHPFVARHNDLVLARRLQARQPRLRVLDGFHHPASVLAAFGHLAAVVSMRYHSLLFAERAGTPLIALPYAAKTRTWLAEHGRESVEPTPAALVEAIGRALAAQPAGDRRIAS